VVAGCRRLFEETAAGGRWERPELQRLLDQLREGDTLVVWKLDRNRPLEAAVTITQPVFEVRRWGASSTATVRADG
jgi:hypothetical protein